jgi:thymidylate kinase
MRGKFIVIDGVAPISTQVELLCQYLSKIKKLPVKQTKEPTDSAHIRYLSQMLRDDRDKEWVEEPRRIEYVRQQLLDRVDHVNDFIIPNLENGVNVVSERYKYFTYAYWALLGTNPDELHVLHKALPVPDLAVILESERPNLIPIYPRCIAGSAYQESVGINYKHLKRILPQENIVHVEGSNVHQRIEKLVDSIL